MIVLTEKAAGEVKRVLEEQKMTAEEHALRVGVSGGGCSGFSYSLGFEKKDEGDALNDTIAEFHGITVKMDNRFTTYLEGTTIDFYSGLDKRGFKFENPRATKSCGCGSSFSCGS